MSFPAVCSAAMRRNVLRALRSGPKLGRDLRVSYVLLARMEDSGEILGEDVGDGRRRYTITSSGESELGHSVRGGLKWALVIFLFSFGLASFWFVASQGHGVFRLIVGSFLLYNTFKCVQLVRQLRVEQ